MELLHFRVVGDITVLTVIIGVVGLSVTWLLVKKLRQLLRSQTPGTYQSRMRCPECQWVGIVATLKPLCKKCGNTAMRLTG